MTDLERKRADLADAQAWVEDLRGLNPTREQIFAATNYVALLQDDIKTLEEQLKRSTTMATKKETVTVVTIPMTWKYTATIIAELLLYGSPQGKAEARRELNRMAEVADAYNAVVIEETSTRH
jgi:hypothetical protein